MIDENKPETFTHLRSSDGSGNLEHRVTSVEGQIKALATGMNDIKGSIETLINEVRVGYRDAHAERSGIHKRIDNHEQQSKLTWPAIMTLVAASIMIGGLVVGYINQSTAKMREEAANGNAAIRREIVLENKVQETHIHYMTKEIDLIGRKAEKWNRDT